METENTEVNTGSESQVTEPTQGSEQSFDSTQSDADRAEQLLDLSTAKKYKWFDGNEITADDLRNGYLRQSDYTKKTQEIAQERKYYDNLNIDLAKVKTNPELATRFKEVYPEKYHAYLDYVIAKNQERKEQQEKLDQASDPRVDEVYDYYQKQRSELALQKVNTIFDNLSKKYNMAYEADVVAAANALIDRARANGDRRYEPSEKEYEDLFKNSHAESQKRYDQHYKSKIEAQKSANAKGSDIGSGGGIPGQAPRQARTIKEATKFLEQDGGL